MFQGYPSNFKVTQDKKSLILNRIEHFRTVTRVLIHWWLWNNAQSLTLHRGDALLFLAATKQLYKWYFSSVRLSIRLSHFFHHVPIIISVITNDKNKAHAKGLGQRSKVKVTEIKTQLNCFWTVTPVWIHIWWWNDAHSLMLLRRDALLFFKVIRQISRSHG